MITAKAIIISSWNHARCFLCYNENLRNGESVHHDEKIFSTIFRCKAFTIKYWTYTSSLGDDTSKFMP